MLKKTLDQSNMEYTGQMSNSEIEYLWRATCKTFPLEHTLLFGNFSSVPEEVIELKFKLLFLQLTKAVTLSHMGTIYNFSFL